MVLPHRRHRDPRHRRLRDLPDLPGDAGRARYREAQAGRDRAPIGRGRVLHRAGRAPPRRRARRARPRAGAGANRHGAAEHRRRPASRKARPPACARSPAEHRAGPGNARDLWVAAESIHAVTYFAPECRHALRETGLRGFWSGYFAARAAPLGRVGAGPVAAAFFNFHPTMVAKAVPGCWDTVAPETLCRVRAIAAAEHSVRCATLRPAPRYWAACRSSDGGRRLRGPGRVLAAANWSLWPRIATALGTGGLGEVWQVCTTLREHRGDGHVAALVAHGISGLEAHVLAAGTKAIPVDLLRDNRGWSEDDWEAATAALGASGLLHADGRDRCRAHAARPGRGVDRRARRTRLRRPQRPGPRGAPGGARRLRRRRGGLRSRAVPQSNGAAAPGG